MNFLDVFDISESFQPPSHTSITEKCAFLLESRKIVTGVSNMCPSLADKKTVVHMHSSFLNTLSCYIIMCPLRK